MGKPRNRKTFGTAWVDRSGTVKSNNMMLSVETMEGGEEFCVCFIHPTFTVDEVTSLITWRASKDYEATPDVLQALAYAFTYADRAIAEAEPASSGNT